MQSLCVSKEYKKHVGLHMLLQHTSYNPQPRRKLRQAVCFFNLYWHKHSFALTPLSLLYVCQIHAAVSHWTLAVPAASTAGPASLPLLLWPWSPWQKCRQKHLLCLLPWPGSPFILDNAAASDEGSQECQSVSWCLRLHKHKICRLDTKQMEGRILSHRNKC